MQRQAAFFPAENWNVIFFYWIANAIEQTVYWNLLLEEERAQI